MPLVYSVDGVFESILAEKLGHSLENNLKRPRAIPTKAATDAYREAKDIHPEHHVALTAAELMTSPVRTLAVHLSVGEAARIMKDHGFRHLPVVSTDEKLAGIVSDRDLLRLPEAMPVAQIMTKRVLTATPDTPVKQIAAVMLKERVSALPVLSQNGALAGILTLTDILRAIVERAPIDLWA